MNKAGLKAIQFMEMIFGIVLTAMGLDSFGYSFSFLWGGRHDDSRSDETSL